MIYTKDMIKEEKAKKRKTKQIIKSILLPFVVIFFLILLYMGYLKLIRKEKNISLFGYRQYVILTGSMVPNYNIGDLIIDKKIKQSDIKINDVVTYVEKESGTIITHRIIEFVEQNGKTLYRTKGDNNDSPDPNLVEYRQIQGKTIKKINNFGALITGLTTGTGIIIILLIIILNYISINKREEKTQIREEARKKYNIPKYKKEETL